MSFRKKAVRLKTAKGRKISSTRWLTRQLNDPFVDMSKQAGYVSRAAYKLLEIQEKFKILAKDKTVVDLGAAPGSWIQVVSRLGVEKIVAVDLKDLSVSEPAAFIKGDFREERVVQAVFTALGGRKVDVVLSDMAPNLTGSRGHDNVCVAVLCEIVFDFAKAALARGGSMVMKTLQSGGEKELLDQIKRSFDKVKFFKPEASRKDSSEVYIVATGFRGAAA